MLSKTRIILRHKRTGMYFSGSELEPTKDLWQARRFYDLDYLATWLSVANFAPRNPDEYDVIPVKMTIEIDEEEPDYERM